MSIYRHSIFRIFHGLLPLNIGTSSKSRGSSPVMGMKNTKWTPEEEKLWMRSREGAIVGFYNQANRAVAVLCNHQRNVAGSHQSQLAGMQAKVEAAYLDYSDCCKAAESLLEYKKSGGSSGDAAPPEDLERMNAVWDSIQERDVRDFFS